MKKKDQARKGLEAKKRLETMQNAFSTILHVQFQLSLKLMAF